MNTQRGNLQRKTMMLAFALICTAAIGALVVCARSVFRKADITATASTIASIQSKLRDYAGPLSSASGLSDVPRALTDTEYTDVNVFLKTKSLDPPPRKEGTDEIVDCWGERFIMAVRVTGNDHREFFVWSKGPDRKSGTQDDVSCPPGRAMSVVSR